MTPVEIVILSVLYVLIAILVGRGRYMYNTVRYRKEHGELPGNVDADMENAAIGFGLAWPLFALYGLVDLLYLLTIKQLIRLVDFIVIEVVDPKKNLPEKETS